MKVVIAGVVVMALVVALAASVLLGWVRSPGPGPVDQSPPPTCLVEEVVEDGPVAVVVQSESGAKVLQNTTDIHGWILMPLYCRQNYTAWYGGGEWELRSASIPDARNGTLDDWPVFRCRSTVCPMPPGWEP